MSLAVVGAAHKNADGSDRGAEIGRCLPGDPVALVPEPDNEFDRHAIAVFSMRGVQIGYLTAERAPRIGSLIHDGHEVTTVFQREARFGAWIRVAFDGEQPVVTDAMLELQDDNAVEKISMPDFYPDEEWPDD